MTFENIMKEIEKVCRNNNVKHLYLFGSYAKGNNQKGSDIDIVVKGVDNIIKLKEEIDRIATTTEFNGTRLLAGNRDLGPELSNKADRFPLDIHVGKNFFEGADQSESPVNIIKID